MHIRFLLKSVTTIFYWKQHAEIGLGPSQIMIFYSDGKAVSGAQKSLKIKNSRSYFTKTSVRS